ncbi:UAA transporter family-domain-containing protein [Dactylonectria macrodidyma]|uniref:Protein phosphatase PP2A regulatory subunit B n=1 Tax=Dactylonectria macrodidyma TaxID=307937 RepID=A0A9P9EEZ6_9HYPO|nr:UAA transporter family-domain-containing protein [Dactylonectria macrodidyma]
MVDSDANSPTWKFTQCFGDKGDVEDITEADIISTVEFDHTGNYLATGDKGGRVVLFERNETKKTCEYKFHTEFQSHEPEFDYLKSLEIEEKINKIKWCRRQNSSHYLLSTNDKTIKLWKVFEKSLKVVAENNLSHDVTPGSLAGGGGAPRALPAHQFRNAADLKLPRLTHHDTVVAAVPRRTYANAHAYHINSISVNSDGETFISSDDLRINLWNLNIQDQSFNIVDIKPANMEELTEVITAAEFHPMSCNWFMYASSKGTIKLADMRESALCDQHAKLFEQEEDPSSRSFFSEIISSISDVRFSYDGRYILSRDYLTVKIWDINMERQPVKTIPIHEHLRPRLCDTYENDSIFDKFEVVFSGDAKNVMTGSYNNNFMIYPSDPDKEVEVVLQADKSAFKAKKVGVPTPINSSTSPTSTNGSKKGGSRAGSPGGQGQRMRKETDADQIDFNKKILHMSWHPFEDSIAIAATNNVSCESVRYPQGGRQLTWSSQLFVPGYLLASQGLRTTLAFITRGACTLYLGLRLASFSLQSHAAFAPDMTRRDDAHRNAIELELESGPSSLAQRFAREMGPSLISAITMLGLIFGGCCSNVYALEAILTTITGTLLTFVQFLFVAVTGFIAQFDWKNPYFLAPNKVPIRRWMINIVLFFTINVLNNHAFSYDISVPVHIILRSGGSITTMAAGYLYGKKYTRAQILAVVLLTFGVILAAWSDSQAKEPKESSGRPAFSTGLVILFVAQVLSAIMGLYTEATYAVYGPQWKENLFYSHALSLPLFLPFFPSMARTMVHLLRSPPLQTPGIFGVAFNLVPVPSQLVYLVTNVLTQYACIRGVNLLAALSTALTVTIVLNIRKLVSLLLSIWLFGNVLAPGTMLGAIVVFSAGGLYTMGTKRKVEKKIVSNGREEKTS